MKKSSRFTICLFIGFLFSAGCSIFDLKSPAAPDMPQQMQDPLNIRAIILSVTHEVQADMNYRDYFTNDVIFESFNLQMEGQAPLLRMLDHLRHEASFVDWQIGKDQTILESNNRWFVKDARYIVYSKGEEPICTGRADFRIVKEANWMISYWKDMPDNNADAFFEP
ncbi:MAG: hypothetical protein FWE57_06050 [Chitinispirillia bacterium]|nr:hypothetical protein [Chitinispirillia bacterium]